METKSMHPVDKGWAWMIVLGYFISVFCMVGIAKSFGIFLEEFTDYFDIPVALAAAIMGVSGAVYTVTAPICVAAGQHFTQRKVVMFGGLIGGIGLTLSGFLFNIEWVIVFFGAFFGIGNACVFGNGLVMLGQYFNKRRSLANGLALSGASIGQFALPPLLQYLLDTYALKGTLVIIGGVYFNVILCGMLYRPLSFYKHSQPSKTEEEKLIQNGQQATETDINETDIDITKKIIGDGDGQTINGKVRYRTSSTGSLVIGSVDSLHTIAVNTEDQSMKNAEKIVNQSDKLTIKEKPIPFWRKVIQFFKGILDFRVLKSYIVLLFVTVSFLLFFGNFNFVLFMPAAAFNKGVEKYQKAWLVSVNGAFDLIGRLVIGVIGDLHVIERYKLMTISTFFCGISIFCFSFADTFTVMAVFVGMYGLFSGGYVAINAPTLIDMVGLKSMPKVLGVVLFIQGLGAAVGQPLLGAIRDKMGHYQLIHYINSFTMVLGSILLFTYPLAKRMEERRQSSAATKSDDLEIEV